MTHQEKKRVDFNRCLKYGGVLFALAGILAIISVLDLFGNIADLIDNGTDAIEWREASTQDWAAAIIFAGIFMPILIKVSEIIGIVGLIMILIGVVAYYAGNSRMQKNKQLKLQEEELNALRRKPKA